MGSTVSSCLLKEKSRKRHALARLGRIRAIVLFGLNEFYKGWVQFQFSDVLDHLIDHARRQCRFTRENMDAVIRDAELMRAIVFHAVIIGLQDNDIVRRGRNARKRRGIVTAVGRID